MVNPTTSPLIFSKLLYNIYLPLPIFLPPTNKNYLVIFLNPSPPELPFLRSLPYISLRKTQGRSVIHVFLYSSMCFLYNNIKHSHLLPLYCCVTRQRESVRFDFVTVAVFSTPPSFGHLPYILLCKTQGRRGRSIEC